MGKGTVPEAVLANIKTFGRRQANYIPSSIGFAEVSFVQIGIRALKISSKTVT